MSKSYNTTAVFVAGCIGMCFFGISMITLGSILPTLTEQYGIADDLATNLSMSLPIGMLIGSLIFGPIVDRFGHKMLLICGSVLVTAALLAIAFVFEGTFANPYVVLLAACFVIGLGGGILNGETNALVTDIYDDSRRSSRLSLLGMFYGLGAITIPMLLRTLQHSFGYFEILSGFCIVLAIGIVYCTSVKFPEPKQAQGFPLLKAAKILTSPILLLMSFVLFFQSGLEGITNNWSSTYLVGMGHDTAFGQDALIAMMVGLTSARFAQTFLFRVVKADVVLLCSLGLVASCYAILTMVSGSIAPLVAMFGIGFGLAATFPVTLDKLGREFPDLTGTAFSVALVISLLGQTILNNVTGRVNASVGVAPMPYIAIGGAVLMIILFTIYKLKFNNSKH